MGALVLGGAALVVAITLLRWFAGADTKALMTASRYFGAALFLLAALGLAALDRVALAMLAGSMAWGLFTGGHAWPGGWPFPHPRNGPTPPDDTTSHVKTEWLDMELSHASGKMTGRVLQGEFAGELESFSKSVLGNLYPYLKARDAASVRLLEAYLDRRFGAAWRTSPEFSPPATRTQSGMSRQEAFAVLGLSPEASPDDIRAAYHRLIVQNHPDHGGSSYLAAKINEAKDVLLD
jgi:hypothetical protein